MNLRLSTINDAELLLSWRNDKLTRSNSFNTDMVSLEDHTDWFIRSLKSTQREIYIAEVNNIPVGTIRLDINDDSTRELSWTISPTQRGMGYGTSILKTFLYQFPSTYIARIKKDNISSIRMVEKNGFVLSDNNDNILTFTRKVTDLEIIDAIQRVRNKNNVNWMDILRIAFTHAPEETRDIFKLITDSDGEIGDLSKLLSNNE